MTGDANDPGEGPRGCANLAILLSAGIWWLLFFRAAGHYRHVATFGYPDATGAWDFWVYLPLAMAVGLVLSALVFNFVLRSTWGLAAFAGLALMAVLPYLAMTSGGV